jgi:hypothetical protein
MHVRRNTRVVVGTSAQQHARLLYCVVVFVHACTHQCCVSVLPLLYCHFHTGIQHGEQPCGVGGRHSHPGKLGMDVQGAECAPTVHTAAAAAAAAAATAVAAVAGHHLVVVVILRTARVPWP